MKKTNKTKKNLFLGRTYPGLWKDLCPVYGAEVTVQPSTDKNGWTVYTVTCDHTCARVLNSRPWGGLLGYDAKRVVLWTLGNILDYQDYYEDWREGVTPTWATVIRLLESKGCRVTRTARGGYHFSF